MESLKDRTQELQDIMDEFAGAKKNASIFVKEAAEKGDIVIGSFCQYAPMEIINAGGMYNVLLCGFNYDPPIPLAETELPANLCPLIKVQLWQHTRQDLPLRLLFRSYSGRDYLRRQEKDV